jgi:N-acetylglucosamine-6-sulfatase
MANRCQPDSTPARRRSCAALAAAIAVLGWLTLLPAAAQAAPNFIVLMTDDQASGEMSVMPKTRNLIGRRGVSFDRFYSSFPLCCPSRTTFLTGQYSHNHGVLGNGTPIGGFEALDQPDTLNVWLQNAGYHTVHVGKYLNGYGLADPTYVPPGWDEWYGALDSTTNRYQNYQLNENGTITGYGNAPADYKTDVYARKTVAAIEQRAALGPAADPFFIFTGFTAPHLPAEAARRHRTRFRARALPRARSFNEADVSDKPRFIRKIRRFSAAKVRKITRFSRSRARTLLAVDEAVASIVRALQDNGLGGNTYVMFVSDNGFFFGQHRIGKGKYLPYEGAARVPLLIRGPGVAQNRVSEELTANVDLAPTILELSGATPSVTVDGRSLLPYLQQPSKHSNRPILLEANTRDDPSPGLPYTGIRTQRFKFIKYRTGEEELYDLARDPGELTSRHRSRRYRRTRRALANRLGALRNCAGAGCRASAGTIPGPR